MPFLGAVQEEHAGRWLVSQLGDNVVALARFSYARESLESMRARVARVPYRATQIVSVLFQLVSGPC